MPANWQQNTLRENLGGPKQYSQEKKVMHYAIMMDVKQYAKGIFDPMRSRDKNGNIIPLGNIPETTDENRGALASAKVKAEAMGFNLRSYLIYMRLLLKI